MYPTGWYIHDGNPARRACSELIAMELTDMFPQFVYRLEELLIVPTNILSSSFCSLRALM